MKFEIGDRVEVIAREDDYDTVGLLGTVKYTGMTIGVEHDLAFDGGHEFGGPCRRGCGLWYHDAENQLISAADDETPVSCAGLEELL